MRPISPARSLSPVPVAAVFLFVILILCAVLAPRVAAADPSGPRSETIAPAATDPAEAQPGAPQRSDLSISATGEALPPPPSSDVAVPDSAEPPPPGVVVLSRPSDATPTQTVRYSQQRRWGLFAAGLVLFLVGYGADIGLTYGFGHTPSYTSLIPIVGPFIQMGQSYGLDGPPINSGDPEYDRKITNQIDSGNSVIRSLVYAGLAVDAVLQLGGATMAILGATLKRPVRTYAVGPARPKVAVTPASGGLRITW
jgi:hypothetical protein